MIIALGASGGCALGAPMSETVVDKAAGMNGSFEVSKSGLPVNWLFYTKKTVPSGDFDILIDTKEFKDGKQSLKFAVRACSETGGRLSPGFCKEFKAKPGDPNRRPAIIAPYQPRIDWQIWFAAMASPAEYPWTLHFVWKLLHNDTGTLSLLANNPFPNAPPHYIRARLYRYQFAPPGDRAWWRREPIGEWLPALSTDDAEFRRFLTAMHWLD